MSEMPDHHAAAALRRIPQLQRLLESPEAQQLCRLYRREEVLGAMRHGLDLLRAGILGASDAEAGFSAPAFFAGVRQALECSHAGRLRRVINATGVVLHTNLGRAPLAPQALDAIRDIAAGYSNLEFDLETGERGSRYSHVEQRLCRITGAEAALVVNNCTAAVLLALMAFAQDGEVIVSRGELIEIGGSFRLPDVIRQSGARLVEVGATNKTRIGDYEAAITAQTRILLKSHPSNYRIVGFCEQAPRQALAALARERGLLFLEDLGSGALVDLERFGLPHEPTAQECVQGGAGLVAFSADKLLGGPQAGIIAGQAQYLAQLKRHPLLRALRIDKLSLAALEATLALYESAQAPEQLVPALRMLSEPPASIARRARRLARALRRLPGLECRVAAGTSLAGGGSLPGEALPTWTVSLRHAALSPDELAGRLRRGKPALAGRIENQRLTLDLRTVADGELRDILHAVEAALQ